MRKKGYATLIVSNTSWGSPRELWEEQLAQHGLSGLVGGFLWCRDVGWRKPAPPIFHEALRRTGPAPRDTAFVGDDPRWDVASPLACGITPVLVDREGKHPGTHGICLRTLSELPEVLDRLLPVPSDRVWTNAHGAVSAGCEIITSVGAEVGPGTLS